MSEIDLLKYHLTHEHSVGCANLRELIIRAKGKGDLRRLVAKFVAENCQSCGEKDAVVVVLRDSIDRVFVRNDSVCAKPIEKKDGRDFIESPMND